MRVEPIAESIVKRGDKFDRAIDKWPSAPPSSSSPKLEKFTTCQWLRKERSGLMPLMVLRLFRP